MRTVRYRVLYVADLTERGVMLASCFISDCVWRSL